MKLRILSSSRSNGKKIPLFKPVIRRRNYQEAGVRVFNAGSRRRRRLRRRARAQRRNPRGPADQSGILKYFGRFWNASAVVKHLPVGKYAIGTSKYLSKSTQFSIIDTTRKIGRTGNWAVRVDRAHKGVKHAHVNINPRLTGVKDPHLKLPDWAVTAAGGLNKTLRVVGKAAMIASVVTDTVRVGYEIHGDVKRKGMPGKRTGKTVASVGGAYAGGAAGVLGGNTVGAWIGGGIGALFGGVGAVPGAAVGSLLGSVIGGIGGAYEASWRAEQLVDDWVPDSDDEDGDEREEE